MTDKAIDETITDINKLIDIPLNELTEEQAQIVIEWKAKAELSKLKHEETFKRIQEESQMRHELLKNQADKAIETLEELKRIALEFYNAQ